MEIIFCSVCNESIPAVDLEAKRAVQVGGRAICARCEAAMSPHVTSPLEDTALSAEVGADTQVVAPVRVARDRAERGLSVGIAAGLGAFALLVAGGAGAFLYERGNRLEDELERRAADQAAARAEAERMERSLAGALESLGQSQAQASEVLASLEAEMRALTSQVTAAGDGTRSDLVALAGRLDGLESLRAALGGQGEEIGKLQTRLDVLRQDLQALVERTRAGEAKASAPAPEPPKVTAPAGPAWRAYVADLTNANSGLRWQAVQSLGAARDPAVVELLLPMLSDADIFVRMATARVLGDLGSTAAVAKLIDALEDPEASVREAADVALRAITGQDFQFDAGAKDAERAKRVKAWREWWRHFGEENGASVRRAGAGAALVA
jgi:HEAT repeat protein